MFISKNKKTRGRYYVYYINDGRRKSITTGTSFKNEALAFLVAFANKINEINSTIPSSKPLKMFSELEQKVMNYVSNNFRKGTVKIYNNVFRIFEIIFGDRPLNQIANKDIEYYKSCRLKEVTHTTINIDLNTLKSIFNIGIKFGWCLHNPVKGIKRIKIPQKERLEQLGKLSAI